MWLLDGQLLVRTLGWQQPAHYTSGSGHWGALFLKSLFLPQCARGLTHLSYCCHLAALKDSQEGAPLLAALHVLTSLGMVLMLLMAAVDSSKQSVLADVAASSRLSSWSTGIPDRPLTVNSSCVNRPRLSGVTARSILNKLLVIGVSGCISSGELALHSGCSGLRMDTDPQVATHPHWEGP